MCSGLFERDTPKCGVRGVERYTVCSSEHITSQASLPAERLGSLCGGQHAGGVACIRTVRDKSVNPEAALADSQSG